MWRYHGVCIVHEDYTIKGIDTIYEDGKTSTRSQHQGLRLWRERTGSAWLEYCCITHYVEESRVAKCLDCPRNP